jgi:hypothetical protein
MWYLIGISGYYWLKVRRGAESLEGGTKVEWGKSTFSPLHTRFNVSYGEEKRIEAHGELFQPKSPSGEKMMGSFDGTFDGSSGRHKLR